MFHVFYPGTYKDRYYLRYDSECTIDEIVEAVLTDPVRPKMECPAIILNRFRNVDGKVRNRYADLIQTTGWFGLDVDGTRYTQLIKQVLFDNLNELKIVWVSSSGKGVKAIGYTPVLENLTPERFKISYSVLCADFRNRCSMKINFDQAMNRCHQPIFINSDPNAYTR